MSNTILIFSLGTGIGVDYSPTTVFGTTYIGIIEVVIGEVIWVFVF